MITSSLGGTVCGRATQGHAIRRMSRAAMRCEAVQLKEALAPATRVTNAVRHLSFSWMIIFRPPTRKFELSPRDNVQSCNFSKISPQPTTPPNQSTLNTPTSSYSISIVNVLTKSIKVYQFVVNVHYRAIQSVLRIGDYHGV